MVVGMFLYSMTVTGNLNFIGMSHTCILIGGRDYEENSFYLHSFMIKKNSEVIKLSHPLFEK